MYTKESKGIITAALLMFLSQTVTYIFTHHVMVNNNLDCLNKEEKVVTFNIWYTHSKCILLDVKMQQLDPTIKYNNRGGSTKTSEWPNSFPKKNCFYDNYVQYSWFQTFAMFWMLFAFLSVIPWSLNLCAGVLEHSVCSIFIGAYEDGTERVFWNVGILNSDSGELPRRKHTTIMYSIQMH